MTSACLPMPLGYSRAQSNIEEVVQQGARHAAAAQASVFAVGLDVLGDIELPPSASLDVNRAQMRALGALYLAADLEPAGIISSVEMLASMNASGAVGLDLGPVASRLHDFWRARNQRPDPKERATFYARLFGVSYGLTPADGIANTGFESLMLELCEAIYRFDEYASTHGAGGPSANTVRIRSAARNLLGNLARAGGGMTPFMASELMSTLKQTLDILKHPHMLGIFGARDVWGVIAGIRRRARQNVFEDPRVFVERGRAGMTMIVWLADAAQGLKSYGQPIVTPGDPIIPSAVEWLNASLTISERQSRQSPPPLPNQQAGGLWNNSSGAPSWADIGA